MSCDWSRAEQRMMSCFSGQSLSVSSTSAAGSPAPILPRTLSHRARGAPLVISHNASEYSPGSGGVSWSKHLRSRLMRSWDTGNWSLQLCVVCLVSGNKNNLKTNMNSTFEVAGPRPGLTPVYGSTSYTIKVSLNKSHASAGTLSVKAVISGFPVSHDIVSVDSSLLQCVESGQKHPLICGRV